MAGESGTRVAYLTDHNAGSNNGFVGRLNLYNINPDFFVGSLSRRVSRLFSSSFFQLRTSLNEAKFNPQTKKVVLITAVLLVDIGISAVTISIPGLFFTIVIVPLSLLSSMKEKVALCQKDLETKKGDLEKKIVLVSVILLNLGCLLTAAVPVNFFVSVVLVPLTFFNFAQIKTENILYLKSKDPARKQIIPVTDIRLHSKTMGKYGYFIKGMWKTQKVALKFFKMTKEMSYNNNENASQEEKAQEIFYLKRCRDYQVFGVVELLEEVTVLGDDHDGIIMQDKGMDLAEILKQKTFPVFALHEIGCIISQVLRTLDALHNLKDQEDHDIGIVHADLKMENLLCQLTDPNQSFINTDSEITLIDFGLSHDNVRKIWKQQKGTPEYMAPEIFLLRPQDSKVDMWALGVILFYCIGGKCGCEEYSLMNKINQNSLFEKIVLLTRAVQEAQKNAGATEQDALSTEQYALLFENYQQQIDQMIDDYIDTMESDGTILGVWKNTEDNQKLITLHEEEAKKEGFTLQWQWQEAEQINIQLIGSKDYSVLKPLIKGLLKLDPQKRFSAQQALELFSEAAILIS